MLKKSKLKIILQRLEEIKKPKVTLEQYTIPGDLAAEILNLAFLHGDIEGKVVLDFGCGSGRLTIGAALLGAKLVIGIDVDKEAIKIAKKNLRVIEEKFSKEFPVYFVLCDVRNWEGKANTIVQNPPFGIQNLHADRIFLKKALECGEKIYSLHRGGYKKTREFLTEFIRVNGGKVLNILKFKFRIPYMFKFHRKPQVSYDVDLYIIRRLRDGVESFGER